MEFIGVFYHGGVEVIATMCVEVVVFLEAFPFGPRKVKLWIEEDCAIGLAKLLGDCETLLTGVVTRA